MPRMRHGDWTRRWWIETSASERQEIRRAVFLRRKGLSAKQVDTAGHYVEWIPRLLRIYAVACAVVGAIQLAAAVAVLGPAFLTSPSAWPFGHLLIVAAIGLAAAAGVARRSPYSVT